MSLEAMTDEIRRRMRQSLPLGYRVKVALQEGGTIFLDGTCTPAQLSNADQGPADATIRISEENLRKLLAGSLDPTMAYMTGKLKVEGSLGVAMKLNSLFGD